MEQAKIKGSSLFKAANQTIKDEVSQDHIQVHKPAICFTVMYFFLVQLTHYVPDHYSACILGSSGSDSEV